VPIAAAHRTAPRAIGEHARGSLKDVAVDALDRLPLASSGDADQDFLGEVLASFFSCGARFSKKRFSAPR